MTSDVYIQPHLVKVNICNIKFAEARLWNFDYIWPSPHYNLCQMDLLCCIPNTFDAAVVGEM